MNRTIELLDWYGKIHECIEKLPDDERIAFDEWDKDRPEGMATSDWPGFVRYNLIRPKKDLLDAKLKAFEDLFDEEECKPFGDDPETIAVLARVGGVIKTQSLEDAYEWLDALTEKLLEICDRMEKVNRAQKELKYIQ